MCTHAHVRTHAVSRGLLFHSKSRSMCCAPQLENELTYDKFVEWTRPDLMGQTELEVRLPRFKMEESYDLNDVLKIMGMVDAFDVSKSDFSGTSYVTLQHNHICGIK